LTLKQLLVFFVCLPTAAAADWYIKPSAGVGFTNNANYEDGGEDSDFFLFLKNSATYSRDDRAWSAWLSYRAYMEEKQNDAFMWRLGTDSPKRLGREKFDLNWGFGGQHYTGENPGTTEENFDYLYGEVYLGKDMPKKSDLETRFEGGYNVKNFTRFGGRWDHTLFATGLLDWDLNPRQTLSPYAELGLVFSNDSLYRKNYLEFGLNWRNEFRKDLHALLDFSTRFSTFPNRPVNAVTTVSRRRGVTRYESRTENETHSYVQLKGSLVKIWKEIELTGSLLVTNQSSKSGYEEYMEFSLLGFVSRTF
jgi:hypothetical protein